MNKYKESLPTFLIIVFLIVCLVYSFIKVDNLKEGDLKLLNNVKIVPTLITNVDGDSIFSPTFQLIWNDLKNEVVKNNIVFKDDKNNQMAFDLNQETFKNIDINSDYYYKKFGLMNLKLKSEIEKDILTKFNEKSNILDEFEFLEESQDYFFYSMLVREFEFLYPFDKIDDKEFGITRNSDEKLNQNIKVLYYIDSKKYAVCLLTKNNDEIILVKGLTGNNFKEMYEKIDFSKREEFSSLDTISISNFNFNVKTSFSDLENKEFLIGEEYYKISKTLEVIEFKMNNKGGKVKSESAMEVNKTAIIDNRHFDFSDDFTLFIKEKDKNLPYFAIRVYDIEKFR